MNTELAIQKNLIINGNKEKYNALENTYRKLFIAYILEKTNIAKYDSEINNSDLLFQTNKELLNITSGTRKFNEPQQSSTKNYDIYNLKYFFLMNNFFIEKLSIEDLNILNKYINIDPIILNDEVINLIERTINDIIIIEYLKDRKVATSFKINYGVPIPNNFASNDVVVIKLLYGNNLHTNDKEEYHNKIERKKIFIKNIKNNLMTEFSNLGIKIEILSNY